MLAHAPSLADVARDVASGAADARQLHEGFRALGVPEAGVVPVFTSVEQLALARGTVLWFSTTGADLLAQLPAGYDLVLDIAGPHPLRLHPGAAGVHATISLGAVTP